MSVKRPDNDHEPNARVSRRGLNSAFVAMTFAVIGTATAHAATRDAASVLQAERARYDAMVSADSKALDALLADEATYYHTTGWAQTKAEHIGHVSTRTAVYRKIDILESKQRVIGDVGIIEGTSQFTAGPTTPISYKLSFITVFVWRDQRWQMLTFHCAKVPEEGAKPPGAAPGGPPPNAVPRS